MKLMADLIILMFIIYFVVRRIFKNDVKKDISKTLSIICSLILIKYLKIDFVNDELQINIAYLFDLELHQLNHDFFYLISILLQFLIYFNIINLSLASFKNIFFTYKLENTKTGGKYLINQTIIILTSFFRSIIILSFIITLLNSLSFNRNFDRKKSFDSKTYYLLSSLSNKLIDDGIN